MKVFDTERCVIRLAPDMAIVQSEIFQMHPAKTVAVFSDSQASIRQVAHVESGPGQ
jgi:hypothetical protein